MFKKWLLCVALLSTAIAHAFTPQSGSWVIDDELDGKPGRGMTLDVQNTTMVMTMYAYETNGQPTFYVGAGTYSNGAGSVTLQRYAGGVFLGSTSPMSATGTGSPGAVAFQFTSGTKGTMTLPGEPPKAITRYEFGYASFRDSLIGSWVFSVHNDTENGENRGASEIIFLGSAGHTFVGNSGLYIKCDNPSTGTYAGYVACARTDNTGRLLKTYYFKVSGDIGEGFVEGDSNGTNLYLRRLKKSLGADLDLF